MKKSTFIYAASALLLFSACSKDSSKEDTTSTTKDSVVVEEQVEEAVAQDYKLEVTGNLGKYPVEMLLVVHDDGEIIGQYRYTASGSGAWIPITGVMNRDNTKMQLMEKVDNKVTGDWQLVIESLEPNTVITGEMINFKDQSFDVELNGTAMAGDTGSFDSVITVELPGAAVADDSVEIETSAGYSSNGSTDWDAVLDSYEAYVKKLNGIMSKVKRSDPTALAEYASAMSELQELSDKMDAAQGDMSEAQWKRYSEITMKMSQGI